MNVYNSYDKDQLYLDIFKSNKDVIYVLMAFTALFIHILIIYSFTSNYSKENNEYDERNNDERNNNEEYLRKGR